MIGLMWGLMGMGVKEWWKKSNIYKKEIVIILLLSMGIFYLWYFGSTIGNIVQQDRLMCLNFGGNQPCSLFEFILALGIHSLVVLIEMIIPIILIALFLTYVILKLKRSK